MYILIWNLQGASGIKSLNPEAKNNGKMNFVQLEQCFWELTPYQWTFTINIASEFAFNLKTTKNLIKLRPIVHIIHRNWF